MTKVKDDNFEFVFEDTDRKDNFDILVSQNDKETIAVLKDKYGNTFKAKAVRSDNDEFNFNTGVRLAMARVKKEFYLKEIDRHKFIAKQLTDQLNNYLDKVEFLDKKYGLNREARNNPNYVGKKSTFIISKKDCTK
jgi:hypothetical protein